VLDVIELPVTVYLEHLKKTGKKGAVRMYGGLLRSFEKWLDQKRGQSIETVNVNTVDEYLSTVGSPQAVHGAIRGYFKYRYMSLPMGAPTANDEMQRFNQLSMIHPKRKARRFEKISLSPPELIRLFKRMKEIGVKDELYAGMMLLFYFGARPGELEGHMAKAKISFSKRVMFIQTEKTLVERYLAWHPKLDPYIKTWHEFVCSPNREGENYVGEWITKTLKREMGDDRVIQGVPVTSRTARRTFETQSRLLGMPDIIIRAILGHTDKTMSDVYTDWTAFGPIIRTALTENHYMIKGGIL